MYVNSDSGHYRATDPGLALSGSLGPEDTLTPVVVQATHICMASAAVCTPTHPQLHQDLRPLYGPSVNLCHRVQCRHWLQLGYEPRHGLK